VATTVTIFLCGRCR